MENLLQEFAQAYRQHFSGAIVSLHEPMSAHTTLRLGGPADLFAEPRDQQELAYLLREAHKASIPVTWIGQGSNLLVLDGGIRGLTIRIGPAMSGIAQDGNRLNIKAGTRMTAAAAYAAKAGLAGLTFAGGIPGSIGGGVYMNAGAYGGEMSQVTEYVSGLTPEGVPFRKNLTKMEFAYRHSVLHSDPGIITDVTLLLIPGDPEILQREIQELNARRAEKQPLNLPSAGSTFKRPEGYFAAALIDQCGLKGYTFGGAQVSEKHAGFLVNRGGTAADYLSLIREVQARVFSETGVHLEPEVRILGQESPNE